MSFSNTLSMVTLSDIGKTHSRNEDAVFCDAERGLVILADGMGGRNAGDVAARMTVSLLAERLENQDFRNMETDVIVRELDAQIAGVHRDIRNFSLYHPQWSGMGTTLILGLFVRDKIMLAHVGDSRCYRLRRKELEALTRDHSLLQEQIDQGLVTPEKARFFPLRHLLTQAIGVEEMAQPDFNGYDIEFDDLYLFCSDGLYDMMETEDILHILQKSAARLSDAAEALVAAANANGGHDNISVVLVKIDRLR
jgi:protein phosphatase